MDFPKDPAPTREEMIGTYLQTLAKVVGSYEEAKKKMYAFSTTTYQGFQCLVSEEESEKFKGLPGVVFVLPDSYIDPVNKEYGGDKYENGVITPRPPPVQYGRQGGRYADRNRDFNRNPRQMPNEQGNRGYDSQGPRYGDNRNFGQQQNPSVPNPQNNQGYRNQGPRYADNRNFGQQQNPSVPNQQGNRGYDNQGPSYGDVRNSGQLRTPSVQPTYGPIDGGERRNPLPMNNSPGGRDSVPPYQGNNYNQNQQGYYNPQGARAQPNQWGYTGDNRNYAPLQGVTQGQGAGGNYGQMGGGNGQESSGNYGQMPGGNYGQGAGGNHSQGFQYQQMERRNNDEGGQRNYGQMGQSGTEQGRY